MILIKLHFFSEGIFLCFFIASSSHLLALFSFCLDTDPVFIFSTFSCTHILSGKCNLYCKQNMFMLRWCWTSVTIFNQMFFFFRPFLSWIVFSPGNSSSLLSVSLVLTESWQAASYFGFICYSLFKWNPCGSSKIASQGKKNFLCSILHASPSSFFSCCTRYTKLSSPWQSLILQDLIFAVASHSV